MRFAIHFNFAVEIGGKGRLTNMSWSRLRKLVSRRDNATCYYCGTQDKNGHADHLIPLSKGGTDDPSNLVWACKECNLSKSDMTVAEWQSSQGDDSDPIIEIPKKQAKTSDGAVSLRPAYAAAVLSGTAAFSERGGKAFGYGRAKFDALRSFLEEEQYAEYAHEDKRQGMRLTESGIDLFSRVAKGEENSVLV